jgi:fluoroacetyl-CoA thioesterase
VNREEVGQIIFDDKHVVAADCDVRPIAKGQRFPDTVSTGPLVTLLESMCLRELRRYLDPEERALGHAIHLRLSAPIPGGALLRIRGWVHGIGDHDVTFFVHAQDDHEQVCEGTIHVVVFWRRELARRIERKIEAIARRELFIAA